MHKRFANPRGVLAEVLDMPAEEIPAHWLKDLQILGLLTEYYGPSLKVLEELEDPDTSAIPRLNAIGSTLDKKEYGSKIRARIKEIQEQTTRNPLRKFFFWNRN